MIGKTIDIAVTSVLQTTAGKMIFGKWDERGPGRHEAKGPTPLPAVAAPAAATNAPPFDPAAKKPASTVTDRAVD
jgi:hypothetical protein